MRLRSIQRFWLKCGVLICSLAINGATAKAGSNCFQITPSSLTSNFGKQAVGTVSRENYITVVNNCTTSITINSFSVAPSEFPLAMGYAPWTLPPGGYSIDYGLFFVPDSPQAFAGQFTIDIQGYSPVVVALSGTGFTSGAVGSLNTSSLTFNNVPAGNISAAQKVTLTNTGTTEMTVLSVYSEPPFIVNGFNNNGPGVALQAGQSLPLQVAFSPSAPGTYPGTLTITSNVLPPKGLALTGTAVAAKRLAITNFHTLPAATQGFAYSAPLDATGGVGNLSWSLATGAKLPTGLTLSSSGMISGTLPATLKLGNYVFKATVMDSNSPPDMATVRFTLPVSGPTGASCNNISWDVTGTNTPIVPINDLGTGLYLGTEGGLYLNGGNVMPASHDADGVSFAKAIQPLDANGNPDPNGKYALLSIGLSITYYNFQILQQMASADPSPNSHMVIVNGANPNLTAGRYANPTDPIWSSIENYFLPQAGVTANQVVAAWVMVIDGFPGGTFPGDMAKLQSEYVTIAQNLHSKFPNLTLAFFSTRDYAGYSNGLVHEDDPESYAYETGYAVRGLIEDQLNGSPALNYNPANGPVMAPWLAWANYSWANGLIPRSDGLVWTCQDFIDDGTHNSKPAGREKDATALLNFLKSDDATVPWFLAPPGYSKTTSNLKKAPGSQSKLKSK